MIKQGVMIIFGRWEVVRQNRIDSFGAKSGRLMVISSYFGPVCGHTERANGYRMAWRLHF